MPNTQKHRGQHTKDKVIFSQKWMPILRTAVEDLSFLLSRNYSQKSALKLVGDRYKLTERQRKAISRASCSESAMFFRHKHTLDMEFLEGETVLIDGYNILITIETALSKGILLKCKDDCYRDIASVHGTYRKVEETIPALQKIGENLESLKIKQAIWFLDAPISNSGRLRQTMLAHAQSQNWTWEVELVNNPDKTIVEEKKIALSSDGWVLDHAPCWFNMNAHIIEQEFNTQDNIKVLK